MSSANVSMIHHVPELIVSDEVSFHNILFRNIDFLSIMIPMVLIFSYKSFLS